jgi:hypothetical protein
MRTPAAITAAVLTVFALAGCATQPPVGPASDPGPIDVPVEQPQGDGSWTPDPFFYEVVEGNRSSVSTLVEQWESNDCTVQQAVDGGTGCSTFLSTGAMTIEAYAAIFEDYADLAPGTETGLDGVYTAIQDGLSAALEWTEAECNWETTEDCAAAGQSIIDSVYAMDAGLADWEATR